MNGTSAPPDGVAQFFATLDAEIAKTTEQEAKEAAFQEEHKRRLRGEFTEEETKLLGRLQAERWLQSHARKLDEEVATRVRIVARRQAGRSPRIHRATRTAPKRGDPSPSGGDEPPLRPLPLGILHAADSCVWCGSSADLRRTLIRATFAEGVVCADTTGCRRRSSERRRAA